MPIRIDVAPGKSVVVDSRSASIGADVDCDVVLPREEGIQPRHATIKMVAARWIVESAGDWLLQADDGVPGRKQWLVSGSRIRLNRTGPEIVFSQYEAEGHSQVSPPGVTVAENERQGTCSCGVCPEASERSEVIIAEGAIPSDTVEEVLAERHGLKSQEATAGRRPTFRRHSGTVIGGGVCLILVLLLVFWIAGRRAGTITFAEHVNARTLEARNEGSTFKTGFVHLVVRGKRAFGDAKLVIYHRPHGKPEWSVLSEDAVRPESDVCVVPVFLSEVGDYDIRAATSAGCTIAEGSVHIVPKED